MHGRPTKAGAPLMELTSTDRRRVAIMDEIVGDIIVLESRRGVSAGRCNGNRLLSTVAVATRVSGNERCD